MDDKFILFDEWFKVQKNKWSDMGISVKNAYYEKKTKTYYHNYKIELITKNSEGTITLFESNGCYWVDLECVSFDKDECFCQSVVDFESIDDISVHVKKLETIMS
ncbi:MAG: hypothetical protein NC177_06290 [Ruminococcus flavefaciens]|nr:hypothetical protein [Ruminococcus flavefaciens]